MRSTNPGVSITHTTVKSYHMKKSAFATLLLYINDGVDNKLKYFSSYSQTQSDSLVSKDKELCSYLKIYFDNGGNELYLLTYNSFEFDLASFETYLKKNCDGLTELETIIAPTLLSTSGIQILNCVKIQNFLIKYSNESNRLFITDINQEIKDKYLDVFFDTVIYYPWFKKNKLLIAPSIVASALMSKTAKDGLFFHSIANKKISNLDNQEFTLSKTQTNELYKNLINPIIKMHGEGLKIWGVNSFNSKYKTINELRIIRHIKRGLKLLMQDDLFEINSDKLNKKLFSKINLFLYELWQLGALAGTSKEEAYTIEFQTEETKESENRLIYAIAVSLSKPLEFINLKLECVQKDGILENVSIEA